MIFLAITPKGLADALACAGKHDHVWCGREAVPDTRRDEMLETKVTIFSYAFTGASARDELQGAVWTIEEHHPGHVVWAEQVMAP